MKFPKEWPLWVKLLVISIDTTLVGLVVAVFVESVLLGAPVDKGLATGLAIGTGTALSVGGIAWAGLRRSAPDSLDP